MLQAARAFQQKISEFVKKCCINSRITIGCCVALCKFTTSPQWVRLQLKLKILTLSYFTSKKVINSYLHAQEDPRVKFYSRPGLVIYVLLKGFKLKTSYKLIVNYGGKEYTYDHSPPGEKVCPRIFLCVGLVFGCVSSALVQLKCVPSNTLLSSYHLS